MTQEWTSGTQKSVPGCLPLHQPCFSQNESQKTGGGCLGYREQSERQNHKELEAADVGGRVLGIIVPNRTVSITTTHTPLSGPGGKRYWEFAATTHLNSMVNLNMMRRVGETLKLPVRDARYDGKVFRTIP